MRADVADDPDRDTLRGALAQSRARANLLFALYSQSVDDLARAQASLQQKDSELARGEEQRQQLDSVLNSTSWRLTAPLRSVIDWARRRL